MSRVLATHGQLEIVNDDSFGIRLVIGIHGATVGATAMEAAETLRTVASGVERTGWVHRECDAGIALSSRNYSGQPCELFIDDLGSQHDPLFVAFDTPAEAAATLRRLADQIEAGGDGQQ